MQTTSDVKTRVTEFEELKVRRPGEDCLVVIHAPLQSHLGRRYLLAKQQVTIGRGKDNDIVLSSDSVSRRHSRVEQRGEEFFVLDLGSTNGTFVNDEPKPVQECRLNRGDQLRIGDTIFKYLSGSDVEAQYHEVVFLMRITDGLTNLHNRKQLDTLVDEEISRARRHGRELSVLMLDIDHFKKINDAHGHLAGDSVLRSVAAMMQKRLRPGDKLGRYGGEEFCALLPETSLDNAAVIAEDLRTLVAGTPFHAESHEINVTISIGAGALREGMIAADLYSCADKMLYQAKRTGRNKVCFTPAGG